MPVLSAVQSCDAFFRPCGYRFALWAMGVQDSTQKATQSCNSTSGLHFPDGRWHLEWSVHNICDKTVSLWGLRWNGVSAFADVFATRLAWHDPGPAERHNCRSWMTVVYCLYLLYMSLYCLYVSVAGITTGRIDIFSGKNRKLRRHI